MFDFIDVISEYISVEAYVNDLMREDKTKEEILTLVKEKFKKDESFYKKVESYIDRRVK